MFFGNIRGLWILSMLGSLAYWCALGGPVPTAWYPDPPDEDQIYTTLWQPLITMGPFTGYDGDNWVTNNPEDPEFEAERDVGGEGGMDYVE